MHDSNLPPSTPAEHLRAMRIVSGGLLAGVLLFLGVVLFVRPGMIAGRTTGLDIMAYVAVAWAALAIPIATTLRASGERAAALEQDPPAYWAKRRAASIVSAGLLEGAAFFCCIALLVSPLWWPLFALVVLLGVMVAWFPRDRPESHP